MEVLSVASEAAPLVKTGGLADVAGALPLALGELGVHVRTLLPGYRALAGQVRNGETVASWPDLFGGPAALKRSEASGLHLLVLDAPHLYDRAGGPYADESGRDFDDNWRRFAALARAAADVASGAVAGYRPDLVHAHDWQAGLAPAYLRYGGSGVPSVMTIHNMAFQGQFDAGIFGQLGLPAEAMSVDGVEYYGGVGYLKAGLRAATRITTVSPTYAREIRRPEFGMGLEGLLQARAHEVSGILNGIDTQAWDPATDEHLPRTFSARTLKARAANRDALEARFALDHDGSPLLCVISRLTWQKGMDILVSAFDRLIDAGARIAVLGSGDKALQAGLVAAVARHQGRAGVALGYHETLAHILQGGADGILIPSRFEPCGLTQLYGLRYGCVPVVARTGGLADTVIDANEAALAAGAATGILFDPGNADALVAAAERAVALYRQPDLWTAMQKQGMRTDVSWRRSAASYVALFRSILAET